MIIDTSDINPNPIILFNSDFIAADCNKSAVSFFGFKDKIEMLKGVGALISESLPKYQPSGKQTDSLQDRLQLAAKDGRNDFEVEMVIRGKTVALKISFIRYDAPGGYFIVAFVLDLVPLKAERNELMRRSRLLKSVNTAALGLMMADEDDFDSAARIALETMGEAVNADRVYVWESERKDGELYSKSVCEWTAPDRPKTAGDYLTQMTFSLTGHWGKMLLSGRTINSLVRDLPEKERRVLSLLEIKSLMVLPVSIGGEFWGYIGFDDSRNERLFDEMEESILHSGGYMIVSAALRNRALKSLITAREQALEATRAKSTFLSRMSHEIRTPMNAIIGLTAIASKQTDLNKIWDALRKINDSSRRLLMLINDILDLSKIESGKLVIRNSEFDFSKMLDNIANVIGVKTEERKQKFVVDNRLDFSVAAVGDELRLSQVLLNLLGNANKFTPEGGNITLRLSELARSEKSVRIKFEVIDDGIGIAKDKQKKLFLSYEQAEEDTSAKYGGTGLGLAICHNIVTMMGGEIKIDSSPGKGSNFYFDIELGLGAEISEDDSGAAFGGDVDTSAWKGKTMLLVEDIAVNREIVSTLLEETGIKIIEADNGQKGYELFKKHRNDIDIVLMDIQMPVMNGLTASRKIRAFEKEAGGEKVPILAMTANAFREDAEKCIEAGMDGHITKPIEINVMFEAIAQQLGGR